MRHETIADPTLAPLGREPELVAIDSIYPEGLPSSGQFYRVELWSLACGQSVAIVSDNHGTSLANASEAISKAIREKWNFVNDPKLTIVEDWGADRPFMDKYRFTISSENGGWRPYKHAEWEALGLFLPRDK